MGSALSAAMLELELAFCPPTLGGNVSPPLPCMRSWLWSVCSPHAGRAGSQGNCIVFPTHMLYPLQPTAFRTRCLLAGPLVAALQPHTRPGTLPVTRPGLPPRVSGGQRLWAPPSTGRYSFSFPRFWNVRAGRALGVQPAQPLGAQTGDGPTRASISSRPSSTLGRHRPGTRGTGGPQSSI